MKFIKDALTELDGSTFSAPRLAGFSVVATYLGLAVGDLVMNHHFDASAFGVGAGAVIGAMGIAIHMGEPKDKPQSQDKA